MSFERVKHRRTSIIEPKITVDVFDVLDPVSSISSRTSFGGTSPSNVRKSVMAAKKTVS